MKFIYFDLGETLITATEHSLITNTNPESFGTTFRLIEFAKETLEAIKPQENETHILGIVSDTHEDETDLSEEQNLELRRNIEEILLNLHIKDFFDDDNVILSSDVGFTKTRNLEAFFRYAIEKHTNNINFNNVIFITENSYHINKARELGVIAFQYDNQLNSSNTEKVHELRELIPRIRSILDNT